MSVVTRFAPAPTGYLHLGHVRNARHVWDFARAHGGRVLLRIEDHDRQRCRPEYEAAILEDLAWLGFVPDETVPRQSERDAAYREVLASFIARGLVFGCTCTRTRFSIPTPPGGEASTTPAGAAPTTLGGVASTPPEGEAPTPPEGAASTPPAFCRCRDLALPLTDDVHWRVRIDPGVETFVDLLCGPQVQDPSQQCGDLMIRDRLGNWTYQWAATIDDFLQGVTHVIRGEDLLDSTGRQIRLARLAGRETPATFMHHPLIMKSPTQKLSKSDKDTGVREMRRQGLTPAAVLALC